MEYSERIKKIEELLEQMKELGVNTLSVEPGAKGSAYLCHDDYGDLREVEPRFSRFAPNTIRETNLPNGIRLVLVQGMATERVYRKKWVLDNGNK